jgi:regulator of nucleoside diphosphate kinase
MSEAHPRELGTQLSTWQRLWLWARTAVILAGVALAGWAGGLPVLGGVLVGFCLLFRLITLFERSVFCPHIVVTETDAQRLAALLASLPPARRRALAGLELELERAHVVRSSEVPADVVTMNSRVRFEELHSGACSEARLVYPTQGVEGGISVLEPEGSALLGLSLGQAIDWRMPNGRLRRFRVTEVLYQPEAAGDMHL